MELRLNREAQDAARSQDRVRSPEYIEIRAVGIHLDEVDPGPISGVEVVIQHDPVGRVHDRCPGVLVVSNEVEFGDVRAHTALVREKNWVERRGCSSVGV